MGSIQPLYENHCRQNWDSFGERCRLYHDLSFSKPLLPPAPSLPSTSFSPCLKPPPSPPSSSIPSYFPSVSASPYRQSVTTSLPLLCYRKLDSILEISLHTLLTVSHCQFINLFFSLLLAFYTKVLSNWIINRGG